jgi:hypothetical protein
MKFIIFWKFFFTYTNHKFECYGEEKGDPKKSFQNLGTFFFVEERAPIGATAKIFCNYACFSLKFFTFFANLGQKLLAGGTIIILIKLTCQYLYVL